MIDGNYKIQIDLYSNSGVTEKVGSQNVVAPVVLVAAAVLFAT